LKSSGSNKNNKIICLRPESDFEEFGEVAPSHFNVIYLSPNDRSLIRKASDASVLLIPAVGPKISNDIFSKTSLKMVQVTGAGIDRLDQDFCARNNIKVCNVLGASAKSVAEYCIFAALTISRRLSKTTDEILLGNYKELRGNIIQDRMFSLSGLTLGVIGFSALGCQIQYYDPSDPKVAENLSQIAVKNGKAELLRTSDIISIHVPLIDQTKNLISMQEFSLMKKTSILLNASRGGVVDEHALSQAIQDKKIKGAAIDVFTSEPPEKNNPLLNLPDEFRDNIILTPHIGGITVQSWSELFSRSWINIQRFFDGEELENRQI
jgi:phosphoglycerate dehydrogenase-like enzyme